ncbi:MAG: ribonuclease J [bacterium]|nr:ribonuclease J [bacterium]
MPRDMMAPRKSIRVPQQRATLHKKGSSGEPLLRIIPLGGLEEIGRNTLCIEYGNDIVVMDLGFMFPREDMPGIDYVLADTTYLQENKHKIRGIFITHGHMDHMGAIPYLIKRLGMPPVYGTRLTLGIIRDRLEEFNLNKVVKLIEVGADDTLQLGIFKLTFFRVNHNIPDGVGVAIKTPVGTIIDTGDWKFDHTPQDERPTEFGKIARLGQEGVMLLCSDSTNSEKPGYSISERKLQETIELLFSKAKGRIVVATFSTLISRLQQVINASHDLGRKIAVTGMSMEKAITTAAELGFLKVPKGAFIKLNQIDNYPENKITILSTGSQGQDSSALGRMAHGEHKQIKINANDTIVLSSSPIPGNERSVATLMDLLLGYGAKVVYNKLLDIHSSGHAQQEEQKLMLQLVKPKYFMPIHGERHHLVQHAETAMELGFAKENVLILKNGSIVEFNKHQDVRVLKESLELEDILVDGLGIGDVGSVVLRDRQVMAQDGMVVIIAAVNRKTGKLTGQPDILSRGFIYVKNAEELIKEVKAMALTLIENYNVKEQQGWTNLRGRIRDEIGEFLFKKTERKPMILPVIMQV